MCFSVKYAVMKLIRSIHTLLLTSAAGILLFISTPATGQESPKVSANDLQKIESIKQAYISSQLDLSPDEAKKFWPLYEKYEKEMQQVSFERRDNLMNKKELNKASEQRVKQSLDKDISIQQKAVQIRKNYKDQFMKILPPKKVMKLYKLEREFNAKLIEELGRRSDDPKKSDPKNTMNNVE